jgi:hypothetical protein
MSEAFKVIPLTPMRKVIAARMTEAKRTIPHFRLAADIELDALIELRRELRERHPEVHLSLNDLLIKACATALMDIPAVNIQWAEKGNSSVRNRRYFSNDRRRGRFVGTHRSPRGVEVDLGDLARSERTDLAGGEERAENG